MPKYDVFKQRWIYSKWDTFLCWALAVGMVILSIGIVFGATILRGYLFALGAKMGLR